MENKELIFLKERNAALEKELETEAALERVRSRSMGMQKSEELKEVIKIVYQQLTQLKINLDHSGFVVDYKSGGDWHFWIADEQDIPSKITHPYFESVWANQFNEAKEKGADLFATNLNFEEKNKFYNELLSYVPGLPEASKKFYLNCPGLAATTVLFDNVSLYIENFKGTPYTDEENKILLRFGKVFQQTYTRFLDLQKAEAQAREGQVQLAMERVRARTMAMQHSNELPEAANLLFQQVQALGMPAWSAGYCIWDDGKKAITLWMSSEAVLQPPFRAPLTEDPSFIHMLEAHQRGEKFYVEEVGGSVLVKHYQYMRTLPVVGEILDSIINAGHPLPVFQIFHCAYFSQGFLLFITYEPVPEAHDIFKRFGKVFDQTYTRFLDLQKAEAQAEQARLNLVQIQTEKQRAEDALAELQAAQKQLIQAEKMASLGELTAGIAHEIQNPLNFVNNFSEVSTELVDEMNSEIDKGNLQDAKEIANDLKQNLEKINHHGKRAGDIVKGMLQHSRSSSATKEPTDINKLADEYLRLSYHGLRAKDKSFNATMKTDFDEKIGNINIIPQDIGRVILNLLTNAFYVVDEKKKSGVDNYEPIVFISTKKIGDKMEIKVTDNGNGIPQKVLDKIFQPFFTTKPTGQGTGLGLSLSYDIVKAHSGELKVETKEGEGSTFIIQLPIN